jgi:hypothetical protein
MVVLKMEDVDVAKLSELSNKAENELKEWKIASDKLNATREQMRKLMLFIVVSKGEKAKGPDGKPIPWEFLEEQKVIVSG